MNLPKQFLFLLSLIPNSLVKYGATCESQCVQRTKECIRAQIQQSCIRKNCNGSPCLNRGLCQPSLQSDGTVVYACECRPGYSGEQCETDVDDCDLSLCQNGGTCRDLVNSYACDCAGGYTGVYCESDVDECEPSPCQNGKCQNLVGSYVCNCVRGYTGENCQSDINECDSVLCENGGTCTDLVASYKCTCIPGYKGTNCEIIPTPP